MSTEVSAARVSSYDEPSAPPPTDLPAFIPYACKQLEILFTVRVKTEMQEAYVSKAEGKSKKLKSVKSINAQQADLAEDKNKKNRSGKSIGVQQSGSPQELDAAATYDSEEENVIVIHSTLNAAEQVVGLTLERLTDPPQLLIKVIALCLPFCPLLTTIKIRLCKIRGAILYEIAKALPQSYITDLILDDTHIPVSERCFYKFFEQRNTLRCLSLARCNLSDEDCEALMSCLVHPLPASKTLKILNLTGNYITNKGARSIGECLRTNRSLKYLNLAGNQIGDDGAAKILESLAEFPLTYQEVHTKKKSFLEFLRRRQDIFNKFYKDMTAALLEKEELQAKYNKQRKPSRAPRRKEEDDLSDKAEKMTKDLVGTYSHPYSSDQTVVRNTYSYCIGNMSLCYLNLAYNDLSYLSLKKLVDVAKYQGDLTKTAGVGLLGVQIEGNNLPECLEMYVLQDRLQRAQLAQTLPTSRPRSKSIHQKMRMSIAPQV